TGRRTKISYANNVVTDYEYEDGSFRLQSIKTTAPDGAVLYQHLQFDYNETGLITHITDNADAPGHIRNNRSYLYDELDQLIKASGKNQNGEYTHKYKYDKAGNITNYPEQF